MPKKLSESDVQRIAAAISGKPRRRPSSKAPSPAQVAARQNFGAVARAYADDAKRRGVPFRGIPRGVKIGQAAQQAYATGYGQGYQPRRARRPRAQSGAVQIPIVGGLVNALTTAPQQYGY